VNWLRRLGRTPQPEAAARPEPSPPRPALERATPGVAALLNGIVEDGSHAVLDLGPASESSLRVYTRFARKVRFADLLTAASEGGWPKALSELPAQPERPYDLVFAWDILDRISPEERRRLLTRVGQLTATDARLFLGVDASGSPMAQPLKYTLMDVDRLRYEATGPARPARPPLLPAEVEKLLAPFHVVRAFTLKGGLREYVAVRR
jgi:hypothetical protein